MDEPANVSQANSKGVENVQGNRRPLKTRSKPWAQALARGLSALKVQPNHISLAGIGFALAGAACLLKVPAHPGPILPLLAAGCVQARLLCNLMDGLVAVEGGLKSNYGDLFNEIPDRLEDSLLLISAGYAAQAPELGWLCALLAVFTAYLRAFGGSLGQTQDFCGPMAKPQRMFVLTLGCLVAAAAELAGNPFPVFKTTLWVIALGASVTAIRRIWRIAKASLSK